MTAACSMRGFAHLGSHVGGEAFEDAVLGDGGPAFGALGGGLVRENTFTDRSAAKGVSYIYAVSAVDLAGNEGSRSEEASVVAKGARP